MREDDHKDILGRGHFDVVYKARDMSSNELYAIKEFHAPRAYTAKERAGLKGSWQREIEIMRSLPHHVSVLQF